MPRMGGKLTTKQIYKISSLRPTCPLFKVLMKLTFFCKVVYIRYPAGISGKKHCNEHVMNSNKRTPTLATSTQLLTIFPQVSQMYAMPGKRFTQAFRGSRGIFSVPAGWFKRWSKPWPLQTKKILALRMIFLTKNGGWGGRLAGANKWTLKTTALFEGLCWLLTIAEAKICNPHIRLFNSSTLTWPWKFH